MLSMKTMQDIRDVPYRRFKMKTAINGEEPELPVWAGLAAPYIREHLDGPHDMASIHRSISRKRKSMGPADDARGGNH